MAAGEGGGAAVERPGLGDAAALVGLAAGLAAGLALTLAVGLGLEVGGADERDGDGAREAFPAPGLAEPQAPATRARTARAARATGARSGPLGGYALTSS